MASLAISRASDLVMVCAPGVASRLCDVETVRESFACVNPRTNPKRGYGVDMAWIAFSWMRCPWVSRGEMGFVDYVDYEFVC